MIPGRWLLAAAGFIPAGLAAAAGSGLTPDPAADFGMLPNGVHYVIVRAPESGDRVALRLLVAAGSRQEREDERGLAHFLEHMAFNGSTHYPPGTLVQRLQRMGMSFGADANADTDFDRTLYQLDLPDPASNLQEGLQILADYAGGLLLPAAMIEKERGVILSEKRARDSVHRRVSDARRQFCLTGTLFPIRRPIGLESVIRSVPRQRFVEFYDTWYRPARLSVIVTGNVDSARVARAIRTAFSPLRARAPTQPDPSLGRLQPVPGLHVRYVPAPEEPGPTLTVSALTPLTAEPDSADRRRQRLVREVTVRMFNNRLAILARRPDSAFGSGRLLVRDHSRFYREARIELGGKRERWSAGVTAAEQELRRALSFGFQPEELREAVEATRHELQEAARDAGRRPPKVIADQLVDALLDQEAFLSPEQKLALLEPALAQLRPADCAAALQRAWAAPHRYLVLSGGADLGPDAAARIAAVYRASERVALQPLPPIRPPAWSYTSFGPAGRVVQRTFLPDFGLTEVAFANGLRLNIKPTRFDTDRIEVEVAFGTGEMGEPRGEAGLGYFASQVFIAGGLGRYSADDLQHLFAGQSVKAEFLVTDDAFGFRGATDRAGLEQEFQLLAAEFTDPGYRAEADKNTRTFIASQYFSLIRTVNGPLEAVIPRLLADGDVRIGLPPAEPVLSRTMAEVQAWLNPQLQSGPIEVTVVGDCDVEAVIAAAGATLGALPDRAPWPTTTKLNRISFPQRPFRRDYSIPTDIPTAVVAVYWPTTDSTRLHRTDSLHLLALILEDRLRLKLREQLGDTYTPFAFTLMSEAYPGYGYLEAKATVEPAKADATTAVMVALAADLAAHGVQTDEVERARQPLLAARRAAAATNAYWLHALSRAQAKPATLDFPRQESADLATVNRPELDALARAYLGADRPFRVIVRPALKPAPGPAD